MRSLATLLACATVALVLLFVAAAPNSPSAERDTRRAGSGGAAALPQVDRSPVDLVIGGDGTWLVTVNQTSATASLVRTSDGSVLDEVRVGRHPSAVALHRDGRRVLISGTYDGDLRVLKVAGDRLVPEATIEVGYHPHGIALTADGKTAYVATTAADQVAVVDLEKNQVVDRIDVGRWPRHLALSPDGARLAVGTSGDRGVSVVATEKRELLYIEKFIGLNIGHLQASRDNRHVYFPWMVYRRNPITTRNIRIGWVLASRIARVKLDGPARREAISLDPPGEAIADPHGLALTSDEAWIVASASGSQELLVYRSEGLPLQDYGGTDHLPPRLRNDKSRFYRIALGGRPMGLRIAADDRTVYVANYLDNSVQVIDLQEQKIVRTIPLGGAPEISLARRGEAIFYDGKRSLDQWYSCHSCHYDGGSNSDVVDTLNDGTRFTFKTVLPLYNITKTPPWTWHGWQEDLDAAMHKSITTTMLGRDPSDDDVAALVAYLETLEPPPNPFRQADGSRSEAAQRGEKVFHSDRAGCANCHNGPLFTDGQIHDVGLGKKSDRYEGFNTPSLLNVYAKVRLLHDGRSQSLEDLLAGPHSPAQVTGQGELSDDQRRDLIEYLKSL